MKPLRLCLMLLAALIFSCGMALAQPGRAGGGNRQDRVARVEAARIAFINTRLALTAQQAEKFWPIYNQYTDEARQLRRQYRAQRGAQPGDDDQARQRLDDELDQQQAMLDLRRRYTPRLLEVISAAQVTTLFEAERDFRDQLRQRMQGQRPGRGGGGGRRAR